MTRLSLPLTIAALVLCFDQSFAQTVQKAESFDINIPVGSSSTYIAKQTVVLSDGFHFGANSSKVFNATINMYMNESEYNSQGGMGNLANDLDAGYVNSDGEPVPSDGDAPPGSLPGVVDVSPSGAATYTLPIVLPSGMGG